MEVMYQLMVNIFVKILIGKLILVKVYIVIRDTLIIGHQMINVLLSVMVIIAHIINVLFIN